MSIVLDKESNALSAALLIAGCCIGAGMIGLPVISASAGFIPSTLAMIICYFFATSTGLLILEATLWFDQRVNLLSLADFALGKVGKAIAWLLFLFLFYCLFVAYIDGGSQLLTNVLSNIFDYPIAREFSSICCVGFVGMMAYGGTQAVSRISKYFLGALAISYCALLALGLPHIQFEQLLYVNWGGAMATIPILLVCFGYQNLIPTLIYYVKKNINSLRFAIFVGNLIPFVIYLVWNFVILGILPAANSSEFYQIITKSDMVTGLLEKASQSSSVLFFAKTFSFLAIFIPFMASTLAFVDFFRDGFKMSHSSHKRKDALLYALVLGPPTILTFIYPHLFLRALSIAGGFVDVILFGIFPVLIVWIGRYVKKINGPYTVFGGKIFLILVLLFSVGLLLLRP